VFCRARRYSGGPGASWAERRRRHVTVAAARLSLYCTYATDSLSVRYGTVRTGQPRDAAQPGMAAAAESNRLDLLLSQFWTAN